MRQLQGLLERGIARGFTEVQVEYIEQYVRARIKERAHDEMHWQSDELDDSEGADHHSTQSSMYGRVATQTRQRLVKLGIKLSVRKRNGSQTFYSKKKRPLVVQERDGDMME